MDGSSIMCSIANLTILFSWTFTPGSFLGFGINCSGVVGIFYIDNIWYCRDLTAHNLNWRRSDQNFGRKGARIQLDILENLADVTVILFNGFLQSNSFDCWLSFPQLSSNTGQDVHVLSVIMLWLLWGSEIRIITFLSCFTSCSSTSRLLFYI